MNHRFFKFAKQTKLIPEDSPNGVTPLYSALEDYAKLIVTECANLIDTLYESYDAKSTAGQFLKKHFEMKE
jgi:hypothetical protein